MGSSFFKWIRFSSDVAQHPNLPVGTKARSLAKLESLPFPIPPWFVVLPEAFVHAANQACPSWRKLVDQPAALSEQLSSLTIPLSLGQEIQRALSELGPISEFAVRSSALDEDGEQFSFAGQFESYLSVKPEQVLSRVLDVWISGFSDRVRAYRYRYRLRTPSQAPAVMIQSMVRADCAGVGFSADPSSGQRNVAVISAVTGLGNRLVLGECNADTWRIDREGKIIDRRITNPKPVLTDPQVLQVTELTRRCADSFGTPQDIEWAATPDKLYLLQSRPITSLSSLPDPEGTCLLWDNSNIAESYNGVTTPLTFSFARKAYEEVYRQFCRIMAVSEHKIRTHQTTFQGMLGLIQGRIYYNLLHWYRVLSLLPGFKINRKFMEQMMGVKEPLPEPMLQGFKTRATPAEKWLDVLHLLHSLSKLSWNFISLNRTIDRFSKRLHSALQPPQVPLHFMRPDELVTYYRQLERELIDQWDAPLINDFFAMIFYGLLRQCCQHWCNDPDASLQNDLLSGEGGIMSTEPARQIQRLAVLAAPHPALVECLLNDNLAKIEEQISCHSDFQLGYRQYLEQFGERCLEELKLETLSLHDDPIVLLRAIGRLAQHQHHVAVPTGRASHSPRAEAEFRVSHCLKRNFIRRWLFNSILRQARACVKNRENLRFERTRVFGRARQIFSEMGKRFFAERWIHHPRDIFYLTIDEILGFVEGKTVNTQLQALIELRKHEFEKFEKSPLPANRFLTYGVVSQGNSFQPPSPPHTDPNQTVLKGLGCCPGLVRGRARVILDPKNAQMVPGEILITQRTDPGWIMLFPSASGIVVEYGSLLSHSAIVAREMGIPVIVAASGVTQWVKTGDLVEMDGRQGTLRHVFEEPMAR